MSHYHPSQPGQYRSPAPVPPKPRMPRWGIAVVTAALLLILLIGIATIARIDTASRAAAPTPTPIITPSSAPTTDARPVETATDPVKQRTALYLAAVRSEYPKTSLLDDDTLIGLAQSACRVLESGGDKTDIMLSLIDGPGADSENIEILAFAVGAGVVAFCPEHQDKIQ